MGKAEANLAGVRLAPRPAGLEMVGHRCWWQQRAGAGVGGRRRTEVRAPTRSGIRKRKQQLFGRCSTWVGVLTVGLTDLLLDCAARWQAACDLGDFGFRMRCSV